MAEFNLQEFLKTRAAQDLNKIGFYVVDQLRRTLQIQGHSLTGALEKSIESVSDRLNDGFIIKFYYEQYGTAVDAGISKDRIPYTPGEKRADTSKYIEGLVKYVQQRMNISGDKDALSAAFAIARKHKNEGMSTIASKEFSDTKQRNKWVDNTLERIDEALAEKINDIIWHILDDMVFNAVKTYGTTK